MSDIPEPWTCECGCRIDCVIENGQKILLLTACRPDCENVRWSLELADENDLPVEVKETWK